MGEELPSPEARRLRDSVDRISVAVLVFVPTTSVRPDQGDHAGATLAGCITTDVGEPPLGSDAPAVGEEAWRPALGGVAQPPLDLSEVVVLLAEIKHGASVRACGARTTRQGDAHAWDLLQTVGSAVWHNQGWYVSCQIERFVAGVQPDLVRSANVNHVGSWLT